VDTIWPNRILPLEIGCFSLSLLELPGVGLIKLS
jgi:hypothetical protein